jgi:hypothetical protein
VARYKHVDDLIEIAMEKGARRKWQAIARDCPRGEGRDFLSVYVAPVQRYPRYVLLLRDLLKTTPDFHPDRPFLAAALSGMEAFNREIEAVSAHDVRLDDLLSLQRLLGRSLAISEPGRTLLRRSDVRVVKPRSAPAAIWLFSDRILIAITSRNPWGVLVWEPLESFRVVGGHPSPESMSMRVDGRIVVLEFESRAQRVSWAEPLAELRRNRLPTPLVATARWIDAEAAVPPVLGHDGCSHGGAAWFFGGENSGALVRCDFESDIWDTMETPIPHRQGHSFTECGDKLWLCFGRTRRNYRKEIWSFDPATGTWERAEIKTKLRGRVGHSCVAVGKRLFIFGGRDKDGKPVEEGLVIDTETLEAETVPGIPRSFHAAVYVPRSGVIAVIGGVAASGVVGDVSIFNVEQRNWSPKAKLAVAPRRRHRAFLWTHRLVVVGGETVAGGLAPTEVIDTSLWIHTEIGEDGNIPFGLSKFAIAQIDDARVLVFGGREPATMVALSVAYQLEMKEPCAAIPRRRGDKARTMSPVMGTKPATIQLPQPRNRRHVVSGADLDKWLSYEGQTKEPDLVLAPSASVPSLIPDGEDVPGMRTGFDLKAASDLTIPHCALSGEIPEMEKSRKGAAADTKPV